MKIAVSGKGGVGKTTLAAALARLYAEDGRQVIAIDADPDANLAAGLGIPEDKEPEPLIHMKELILERTGKSKADYGAYFTLNPKVDDLPDKFAVDAGGGVRLLVLGHVTEGGKGCMCPENVLLRNLLIHILLRRDDVVIVDLEAGLEHLGRASVKGIDAMVVVVEPGRRAVSTAREVRRLATDIGLKNVFAVGNRVRSDVDREFLEMQLKDIPLLGLIPFDESVLTADREGKGVEASPGFLEEARKVMDRLHDEIGKSGNG